MVKKIAILSVILSLNFFILLYGINSLSVSTQEAKIFFNENSLLSLVAHCGTFIFGQNDFGLRIPFVFLHLLSCIFLFFLALKYTKTFKDSVFALMLFILLPGSVASALLVNSASFVILLSLIILCAYEYNKKILFYLFLILSLFVNHSFVILFLAFAFFGIYKKNTLLSCIALILFILSISFYGFDTSGRPRGYFLDTLGIFMACFSPLIFIYFFYVIYRLSFKYKKPLLWFLMSVTFVFCSIISIRQKIYLEDFLPFCVISTPLLVKILMNSYRVRLPQLRLKYNIFIQCAIVFLIFSYLGIIFNPFLYYVIKEPKKHFAHNYHGAKELAQKLKKMGVEYIKTDSNTQLKLKFYGINSSDKIFLQERRNSQDNDFKISFGPFDKFYRIIK